MADSRKLQRHSFARISDLDRLDVLITDDAADPGAVDALREAGLDVTIV